MTVCVRRFACLLALLAGGLAAPTRACAEEAAAACLRPSSDLFADQLWPKVVARTCLNCHAAGGDAAKSGLVLHDPARSTDAERPAILRHNRAAFTRLARVQEGGTFRMLSKVAGELDHGGGAVLPTDSVGYRILAEFVRQANGAAEPPARAAQQPSPFTEQKMFAGVAMLDDAALLRRVTLSLAGRLPTAAETTTLADRPDALPELLDAILQEQAFYDRLREGFNDIFLTVGYDGLPERALSYDHFDATRYWYNDYDLSHITEERDREKVRYKIVADYRAAMLDEPMRLVEYIVRHDRPLTEIVTADYILVTPYTARGYGVYDQVKSQFHNADDPFESVPVRLAALKGRNAGDNQESATGFYPHAGLLSTFQYLRRYPTTETNRNRLRARMFYQQFLGIDVMELAPRVADAAAVSAKYEVPTMQAAECVVCHRTVDPVAGLFQDFYDLEETYGRRKQGWYSDMFAAGFEGEDLPAAERWRALQWLGARTAADPRFATAMVEHAYYILTGRRPLAPPTQIDDPLFDAKQRAFRQQRQTVQQIAGRFASDNFNLKTAFRAWILSDFYRADGLDTAIATPERRAELEAIGVVRLLAPEQLERKITAIFGTRWGKLNDELATLYGGIDSQEVTQRSADPSGAMGAIQRMMANEVACDATLDDFLRPLQQRRLFVGITPDMLPGTAPETDAAIRNAMVHLHTLILGRRDAPDSGEIDRTFGLLAGILTDAHAQPNLDQRECYACRGERPGVPNDPHYTLRAWRGVLTYLLRRQEFLYE